MEESKEKCDEQKKNDTKTNDIVKRMCITGSLKNIHLTMAGECFKTLERAINDRASPCADNSFVRQNWLEQIFLSDRLVCAWQQRIAVLHGVFRLIYSLNVYFRKRLALFTLRFISVKTVSTHDARTQTDTSKQL